MHRSIPIPTCPPPKASIGYHLKIPVFFLYSFLRARMCWCSFAYVAHFVIFASFLYFNPHCKDKMPKVWNKYSQEMNIRASVPISTFMCLWENYIFPRWVCLFCWRKYVDRSWEYINRSQTHECGNWGWGRAIPRKGIYKRNCRCSAESWRRSKQARYQLSHSNSHPSLLLFFPCDD